MVDIYFLYMEHFLLCFSPQKMVTIMLGKTYKTYKNVGTSYKVLAIYFYHSLSNNKQHKIDNFLKITPKINLPQQLKF